MSSTLYIVDAHSLIFQVFHAIPEMSAPDGRPTNAVFGFIRDILYLAEDKKPDYFVVAFDPPGPTFRDAIYPDYKAHRPPMPENLSPQIDMIRQVLVAMHLPVLECPGFEADDVIATVVRLAHERAFDVFICTGDKDARQLICPHVSIYNIRKDQVFDERALKAEWGIRPDQVIDLLTLKGDSVDNVPGVEGVGPKTASALLQEFGTLHTLLANTDKVKGVKRQQNLRDAAATIPISRELIALRSDVPLTLDWESTRLGPFDSARLVELFGQFGFRRLAAQFQALAPAQSSWEAKYVTIGSVQELRELAARLDASDSFAMEIITTGPQPLASRLVGIALAERPGQAWYVPFRGPVGDQTFSEIEVLAALRSLLESPQANKVGHNLKHQLIALRWRGIHMAGLRQDTMVADYLLEAGERSHSVEQISARYLHHTSMTWESLTGAGARPLSPELLPVSEVARYACELADISLRANPILESRLRDHGLWELYENVERPLIHVLADMEYDGVYVDVRLLEQLRREFQSRCQEIEQKVYELAGGAFNIASPAQLRQVLFEKIGLPAVRRGRTGPSTDQSVLEALAPLHPLPALLIEHRQITKLMGTYVEALPKLVNTETGRVHASFNQVVAATGRLSSSDPNLQNIPIRTEMGKQIRQAFVPGQHGPRWRDSRLEPFVAATSFATWHILTADYSQVELRILAHLSGDTALRSAFEANQDIHGFVASQIYGVRPAEVTSQMRRAAKAVNFGVVYGLSPFGLAARLGISQEEAEAFIADYFARYSGVEAFIRQLLANAHRNGYVTTILGRRRRILGVRATTSRNLNQSEREAINTVVQGSAADLIKVAMVHLSRRLREEQLESRMVLQIHDELVFEVLHEELDKVASLAVQEMTGAMSLTVPLSVDVAVGSNWLDVTLLG